MLLIEIDKNRYRRHFNIVITAVIAFLVVSSLSISQLLISIFPASEGTHFHWNLTGVIISVLIVAGVLKSKREHPFLYEVLYVWQLKQALNLIARKVTKLQTAAKMGDETAMLALQFSYSGSRQLWTLDDNTITLGQLDKSQNQLDALLEKYDICLELNKYESDLLKAF